MEIDDTDGAFRRETEKIELSNDLGETTVDCPNVSSPSASKDGGSNGRPNFKNYLRIFAYATTTDRCLFALGIVCATISGTAFPLMSIVFGRFTNTFNDFAAHDHGNAESFRREADGLVLWFVYLFLARFALVYVSNTAIAIAALKTTRSLRNDLMSNLLRQEVWHHDAHDQISITAHLTTNATRINQGIAEKLAAAVQGVAMFLSAFVVALAVQWKLALIIISILPIIVIVTGIGIVVDTAQETRCLAHFSKSTGIAQEGIGAIQTVHAFGAQEKLINEYNEHLMLARKEGNKKCLNYGFLFAVEFSIILGGIALAFWEGFRLYKMGEVKDAGTVYTVVLAVSMGTAAMSSIIPQVQAISTASSSAAELFKSIDKVSLLDPFSIEGNQPSICHGDIRIQNLGFAYPSRPLAPVFQGFHLHIPAGKTTALVGSSGCGKSTIIGLLERWYLPDSGTIYLDGTEISKYNLAWLRSRIRVVQQEPVLFRGTIYENVARGLLQEQMQISTDEKQQMVKEACIASNADDFIMKLPNGYDTKVGGSTSMMSGGQKQRVAIARSIVSNPQILLLDEATSALDPSAEGIVQEALDRVTKGKTTLVIAHKLATIRNADNIVVMSSGQIVEQGTHEELLSRNEQYAALVRAQDLGDSSRSGPDEQHSADNEEESTVSKSEGSPSDVPAQRRGNADPSTAQTLGYGLTQCTSRVLMEQKDLYLLYVVGAFVCFIAGATYPAQALLLSRLIRVFILPLDEGQREANFFALMFFVLAITNFAAYFGMGWICNMVAQHITHNYRRELFSRIIHLDSEFFDRPENSSGALTAKLSSVPSALLELIAGNLIIAVVIVVNVVSSSILGIAYGWKLGLTTVFAGMPLVAASGYLKIRVDQRLEQQAEARFSESAALAVEAVGAIKTVASLTLEPQFLREYSEILNSVVDTFSRSLLVTMLFYALAQSIEFLVIALAFWYGSNLVASGEYSVVQFFVVFIAVIFSGQAAAQFFGFSTSFTKAQVAANYVFWLRSQKATIREDDRNKDVEVAGRGTYAFKHVDFSYKQRGDSLVLHNVSMRIEPGTLVACVGASGCGKSTIISLLERFYDPNSGVVTLGSNDISGLSPKKFRRNISLVSQEPVLFHGSIKDNICLGLEKVPSMEVIEEACKQANVLDFVRSLPEGLNTMCGYRGLQLSGGQRQRIAIARALIRKPQLLLLDEATSALDTHSERMIQSALKTAALSSKITTLAVAHRLSTIKHADKILVFAEGKMVEAGTHDELRSLGGRYSEMCLAQSLL